MRLPRRILVANRGEIAVRVIRACRDLGILTVAIFSEPDRTSRHVQMADQAVCVGPAPATESYLCIPSLVMAALLTEAEAIHPGYGFLAENAEFAEACAENGITFIGPPPEAIRLIGDKSRARETAASLGVPIVPGSAGTVPSLGELDALAREVGFPLLLKAAAGGGGRGMQVVRTAHELPSAFLRAQGEATAAFGNGSVYLERYLENIRHIEAQVLADGHGNCVHLHERDCTLQRRHQKILEEAPSPVISPATRSAMMEAATAICCRIEYRSAGTVEFVLDLDQDRFYFIEMNTRLQVEHPVTEMLFGVDLVAEQIRIAAGGPLTFSQSDLHSRGHAIECRINAEDPDADFRPSPGRITVYSEPTGPWVRVDSHCYGGYTVPPFYDSLLAKVIVLGDDRGTAIRRMERALGEFVIQGIPTTIPFHRRLVSSPRFVASDFNTRGLETMVSDGSATR